MKRAKVGLVVVSDLTPLGSMLAAKANTRFSRSGSFIAITRPMIAPSLQPTTEAFWTFSASITATTSEAISS